MSTKDKRLKAVEEYMRKLEMRLVMVEKPVTDPKATVYVRSHFRRQPHHLEKYPKQLKAAMAAIRKTIARSR